MGTRDAIRNLVQAVAENIDPDVDVGIVRVGIPCPSCGENYWKRRTDSDSMDYPMDNGTVTWTWYVCKKCGYEDEQTR